MSVKKTDPHPRTGGKKFWRLAALVLIALLLAAAVWALWPAVRLLGQRGAAQKISAYLDSFGAGAAFMYLALQILQVVIAFLPGEPLEVLAGILYGTLPGLGLAMLGCLVGSALVFLLVRWLGEGFALRFFSAEKLQKLHFLTEKGRFERLVFLLFFIPGTPKDILTYVAGLTPITLLRFLLISTIARIPSIVTSTLAGHLLIQGRAAHSLYVFLATGLLSLAGMAIYQKILRAHQKRHDSRDSHES